MTVIDESTLKLPLQIISKIKLEKYSIGVLEQIKAIQSIHESINWACYDDLSIGLLSDRSYKTYFLFDSEKHIYGYVTINFRLEDINIAFIALASKFHGKKSGRALMMKIFSRALKHDKSVTLSYRANQSHLEKFYTSFNPTRSWDQGYYHNGDPRHGIIYEIPEIKHLLKKISLEVC